MDTDENTRISLDFHDPKASPFANRITKKMYENERRIEVLNQKYDEVQKQFWSNGL